MTLARLISASAAVVLAVAATSIPRAANAAAPQPVGAGRVQTDAVDLTGEQALIDQARAALAVSDFTTARAKTSAATSALLARSAEDQTEAWLALLRRAGSTAWSAQDLATARAATERVLEVCAASLPEDHPDLQTARGNFAATIKALGDLAGARALEERVLEVRSRTLPEDHPDLQLARGNLATTIKALGDLAGARALEQQVLEVRSRTLPEDHPDLQVARANLAGTLGALGDLGGARALFERVHEALARTLPEDHPDLQRARMNLAVAMSGLGDHAGARALEERVLEVFSRTLPADHPELQRARLNLAATMRELGDPAGARALFEQVLEVWSAALPEGHPDLQTARQNLALTRRELGDLAGARALLDRVLEVRSRTLPEGHPDLQDAREKLAGTMYAQGDLAGARALQERTLEVFSRLLPEDHAHLQAVRGNLAVMMEAQGDLAGARALFEQVLEVRSRTLPDDHPDLQKARSNLAATLKELGDLPRACVLLERVLEIFSRTLREDDPDLQKARQNLAATRYALGDYAGARTLFEQVLEVGSRTLPEDHPDLQAARGNLAATLQALGDLAGARTLEERVLEVFARTRPEGHPDLQAARQNLAVSLKALGDLAGARALEERVLEVRSRTLSEEHPDLQAARSNLAVTIATQSAVASAERKELAAARERCTGLLLDVSRTQTDAARAVLLTAPRREAEERCARLSERLDLGLSFARGYGVFERTPELEVASFELSETTRGAALAAARLGRRAAGDARYDELRAAYVRASEELASLVRRDGVSGADFERARVRRESAEGDLLALALDVAAGALGGVDLSPSALATALGPGAVSVGFRRFTSSGIEVTRDPGSAPPRVRKVQAVRQCAFVVRGSQTAARPNVDGEAAPRERLTLVDLGPIEPIEAAVRSWRAALGTADGRGIGVQAVAPGRDALRCGDELRRLVFDPLLAAVGGAQRIVLALDDVLHLVAFDALPLDATGARLVGDRWTIETRATLTELLDPPQEAPRRGSFLGVGGVSYDGEVPSRGMGAIALASSGESKIVEVAGILRGGSWSAGFADLPATRSEVAGIARSFADSFGAEVEGNVLDGAQATKQLLLAQAPGARFLHVATHGWFAPESIRSWSDPRPIDEQLGFGTRLTGEEQVRGMSPMLLCGLALAGANLPEDAVGRAPGLITAEELAALDLSGCELAVLSACDTNVGERRGGQGVASLQRALQMAGARSVITSLWKVPDEATKDLMLDFYRRIWVEEKPKAQALWEAKRRLREAQDERGEPLYTVRDWAAWVLTGDPR